jgi:hypothetical protein
MCFWANGKPPRYPLLVLARCAPRQKLTTTIAPAPIRKNQFQPKAILLFVNFIEKASYEERSNLINETNSQ